MNITPHLGIGDLLIIKMKVLSNNLNIKNININKNLIQHFSDNYDVKLYNIEKFINLLFPLATVLITNGPCDHNIFDNYLFDKAFIFDNIDKNLLLHTENKYNNYIVFHTKYRHDGITDKFINEILPNLNTFLENFKTSKQIIILGEKYIGDNIETRMHKTISLYNSLLLLNKNNNIIDLTVDVLTAGNPNFDSFLCDIEIINKAICNITFGIGGSFNICQAFSENNISFIPFYNVTPYKDVLDLFFSSNNENFLVENVDELHNKLNYFIN